MIHSQFFEDYETGATRETLGRTITKTDIVIHAGQTGDFFPHPMDAEWCKTQDFKQRTTRCPITIDRQRFKSGLGTPGMGQHTEKITREFGLQ